MILLLLLTNLTLFIHHCVYGPLLSTEITTEYAVWWEIT